MEQNYTIPIPDNCKLLNSDASLYTTKNNSITLNSRANIASFKYLMENYLLPMLKQGRVIQLDNKGNIIEAQYPKLNSNRFI